MKKKVVKKKLPVKKTVTKKVVKKTPSKKVAVKKTKAAQLVHTIQTGYLGGIFGGQYSKTVDKAVETLKEFRKKNEFDAIAFMGTSGAGMAFPLSYILKLPLIHVPKPGVARHTHVRIEGTVSSKKYIIVDDFLATGNTVKKIEKVITKETRAGAEPIGIFLYESYACNNPMTLGKHKVPIVTMKEPAGYYPTSYKT